MLTIDDQTALAALRLICGFFFIPHAIGKVTAKAAAFGFFHAAGFRPAALFGYTAMVLEVVMAISLIAGLFVRPVALVAMIYLFIGAAAVIKVNKKWLWHIGGCEYPLFWGICCAIVALSAR
jgi:putative oxidoreductase